MCKRIWTTCGIFVLAMSAAISALAQPKPDKVADPRPARVRPAEAMGNSEIAQKLASEDAAVRQQALESLKDRMASQPGRALDLRASAAKPLLAGKHYAEALDLAQFAISTLPHDARLVEAAQQMKVRALLATGKGEEALQNAKSLFNVATMAGTSESILLLAESINVARPKDREIFNKFREEQIAGAATQPATQPVSISSGKGARSAVLDSIKVDARPYEEALAKLTGEDYQSLMARGNLLLMADRPKDARDVFERMYSMSGASDLIDASEALARLIRAEDGTIGRANSWVGAIKPRPTTAPAK